MGSGIPGQTQDQKIPLGQAGAGAGARFLNAVSTAIQQLEAPLIEARVQQNLAWVARGKEANAMEDAEAQIHALIGHSIDNAFNDKVKIDEIKQYIVKDLGIHDPDAIFQTLSTMFKNSALLSKRKLSQIDRMYYAILQERARHR